MFQRPAERPLWVQICVWWISLLRRSFGSSCIQAELHQAIVLTKPQQAALVAAHELGAELAEWSLLVPAASPEAASSAHSGFGTACCAGLSLGTDSGEAPSGAETAPATGGTLEVMAGSLFGTAGFQLFVDRCQPLRYLADLQVKPP